jgi:hypothetical protein
MESNEISSELRHSLKLLASLFAQHAIKDMRSSKLDPKTLANGRSQTKRTSGETEQLALFAR